MMILFSPVVLLLATLCMQWVELGTIGEFSVKLPYVTIPLIVLLTFFSGKKIKMSMRAIRANSYWIVPFILYLAIMGVVQAGTPSATSVPRQVLFLVGTIALAGSLASTRQLSRTLRLGALIGLGLLIALIELLARQMGLSWWDAISRFIAGDFKFVFYTFFRDIFNSISTSDAHLGGATKNGVAVGVLVLGLLFRSASRVPGKDIAGMAFTVLVLALLLLLNARSVLIAAALALVVTILLGLSIRPRRNLFPLLLKGSATIALFIVAWNASLLAENASAVLGERLAFQDPSTAARLSQYRASLELIQEHPFAGNGYFEFNGYVIHNLFLSAWVQGGLAAFLLATLFYGGLLAAWLSFLRMIVTRPQSWVLPIAPEWIAPLPMIPLVRMWSSGDGGLMYFGEWIAVGCFIGCIIANQVRVRAISRYFSQHQRVAQGMPSAGFSRPAVQH